MTDKERLDWLDESDDHMLDVRGRAVNENVSVREAIDWLVEREEEGYDQP